MEGITPGRALDDPENWLIAVSDTCLMKALSVCYIFKRLPVQDALNFCQRFGIPTVHGETKAAFGGDDWKRFVQALQEFANTQSIATALGDKINVLENSAANGEQVFGWIIDAMKRAMVTICCGSDLATMSRENGAGASLQGDDADELTADFCDFITELFNEQLDRRVIEMEFGDGVEPLAFFKLIPPQKQDAELEMKIDDHVIKNGVKLSVADIAERYNRTHDESADDADFTDDESADDADFADEEKGDAANEAALQTLQLNSAAAFRAGVRRDLRPLNEALLPLVNARGANESRAAFLALNGRAIEDAVLDGDASTAALEVSLATEFLRGLAGANEADEGEAANGRGNPYHDQRGRFTHAGGARSNYREWHDRDRRDAFGEPLSPDISPDDNIARANRAMDWAIKNKRGVRDFMWHPQLGVIELPWGVAGVKSKQYKGGEGLKHLLDKHGEADARRLPKALLDGQMSISKKNPDERDIDGKSYRAVLVKNHKRRNAWVLTGYTNKHRTHL